jgi:hypothetical protein
MSYEFKEVSVKNASARPVRRLKRGREFFLKQRSAQHITRGICGVAPLLGLRHICPSGKRHIPRERCPKLLRIFGQRRRRASPPAVLRCFATSDNWRVSTMPFPRLRLVQGTADTRRLR